MPKEFTDLSAPLRQVNDARVPEHDRHGTASVCGVAVVADTVFTAREGTTPPNTEQFGAPKNRPEGARTLAPLTDPPRIAVRSRPQRLSKPRNKKSLLRILRSDFFRAVLRRVSRTARLWADPKTTGTLELPASQNPEGGAYPPRGSAFSSFS